MQQTVRYLSHPQVVINPSQKIEEWSLNDEGARRVRALAMSNALKGTTAIVSSAETKAIETAQPLAEALDCQLHIREAMHENDRSSTGFLPPAEFETVADQFFATPDKSVRGWETAVAAQSRIVEEVREFLRAHTAGDVLFVGHGGVGTLLYCKLSGLPISRRFDQWPGSGGCFFEFNTPECQPTSGWRLMEKLHTGGQNIAL